MYNFCEDHDVYMAGRPEGRMLYCYFAAGEPAGFFRIGILKYDGSFVETRREIDQVRFELKYMP